MKQIFKDQTTFTSAAIPVGDDVNGRKRVWVYLSGTNGGAAGIQYKDAEGNFQRDSEYEAADTTSFLVELPSNMDEIKAFAAGATSVTIELRQ